MRALVSLTDNCGNNPCLYDWSWSTKTTSHGLLSFYFLMDPYLFLFVLHLLLLAIPNMHDAQRSTSSFKSRNIDERTPSFSSPNTDILWR